MTPFGSIRLLQSARQAHADVPGFFKPQHVTKTQRRDVLHLLIACSCDKPANKWPRRPVQRPLRGEEKRATSSGGRLQGVEAKTHNEASGERTFVVDLAGTDAVDSGIFTWDIVRDLAYGDSRN